MIAHICKQVVGMYISTVEQAAARKYLIRPFLGMVPQLSAKVLDHCKYLQMFPTINFYVAVGLLFQYRYVSYVSQ
jgi:hypothetical protein